jgi:ferredoxin
MAITVNPELLDDIKRYGAFDISACFNCGNCTAVCPLSDEKGSFPRKLIRLGQIGDRARLIEGPEAWLCYYCGECSETCPRQAEPGEYMAAIRRYTIAAYEPTGLAKWMYKSTGIAMLVTLLLMVVLGAFLVGLHPGTETEQYAQEWLFKRLVPYDVIHNMGIGVFIVTTLVLVWGIVGAFLRIGRGVGKHSFKAIRTAVIQTAQEIAFMRRHHEDPEGSDANTPYLMKPSIVHKAIMYGFIGLLLATTLDFLFIALIPLGTTIWPARIIGIVAGIAMTYGVVAASIRRFKGNEKNAEHSSFADWWVLFFLFVLGVTGFWLLGVVTFRQAGAFNDLVLLVHAAMAMELVLLMAFTKLAHVIYRPIALFMHFLRMDR